MTANELTLPEVATAMVIADVTRFGTAGVETGGFLLAPRDGNAITTIALAGSAGIVRRRDLFQVSEVALDRLFAGRRRRHRPLDPGPVPFPLPRCFHVRLRHRARPVGRRLRHRDRSELRRTARRPAAWGWWRTTAAGCRSARRAVA